MGLRNTSYLFLLKAGHEGLFINAVVSVPQKIAKYLMNINYTIVKKGNKTGF